MSTSKMIDLVPANVKFFPAAEADFLGLDKSRQIKVIKALQKISRAPSAFGKELENQAGRPLAGYRSVYVDNRSLRIIWKVTELQVIEVGIAEREGMLAYKLVSRRRGELEKFIKELVK
ncbi:hypothetical protein MOTE_01860 [Moorella thermoacetica]|uniref:Uncharacterized protein n=1 Tax=Neomoorella thermoacetica TaxID=1525 RepID=A0A1J5NSC5_NEOTH|nr:hypothetical protein MOTE_01860 [Moorella thermoacetica]